MGVCVSRDVAAPGGRHAAQQNRTVCEGTSSVLPYIGGRRARPSSPEFSDAFLSSPAATKSKGIILVRPSTISSLSTTHQCSLNGAPSIAVTESQESLCPQEVNSRPSSPSSAAGCPSMRLVTFNDEFTASSSATRQALMSSSSRRFLRSPRTVNFSTSVLTFTDVPLAPPPSPQSAALLSAPSNLHGSLMGWGSLQAELRNVAVQQLEEMILDAGRTGGVMSEDIIDSFLELSDRELVSRRVLPERKGQAEATQQDDADSHPTFRCSDGNFPQRPAAAAAPYSTGEQSNRLSAPFEVASLVDEKAHVAKKSSR